MMKSLRLLWVGMLGCMLFAIVFYLWQLHGNPTLGIDDACIFLGYAKNIAQGLGITYAGNHTPVEGCTSMAWLMLCSLCYVLGIGAGGVWTLQLVLFFGSIAVWCAVLRQLISPRRLNPWILALLVAMLASSPGYMTWMSITLMDVTLWGLVVSGFAYHLIDDVRDENSQPTRMKKMLWSGLYFLAPWVRPETLMIVPLLFTIQLAIKIIRKRPKLFLFQLMVCFAVSTLILFTFRLVYFGFLFPNTYYAKVSPSFIHNHMNGLDYLVGYLWEEWRVWLCVILVLIEVVCCLSMRNRVTGKNKLLFFALSVFGLVLLYVPVLAGGDHFCEHRFFQPVFPLFCVLFIVELCCFFSLISTFFANCRLTFGKNTILVVGSALVSAVVVVLPSKWSDWVRKGSPLTVEFFIAEKGCETGWILNEWFTHMAVMPRIGVITAGGVSLTYSGEIVDLMGLNDVRIAHNHGRRLGLKNHAAFEPYLFDELKIDLIVLDPLDRCFVERVLNGLCATPQFTSRWTYGVLSQPNSDKRVRVFVENHFLTRAKEEIGLDFWSQNDVLDECMAMMK